MTELLRRVISEIEKLPEEQQDVIAALLLDDLKDEQAWSSRFEATTDEQQDRLAEMVRQDIARGETIVLPSSLPSGKLGRQSASQLVLDKQPSLVES